ncbi:hypothetical protein NL676_004706 [Syzygium grande]|nr:hypothetical protein NL676_004706 [Syzygium grande]
MNLLAQEEDDDANSFMPTKESSLEKRPKPNRARPKFLLGFLVPLNLCFRTIYIRSRALQETPAADFALLESTEANLWDGL